jgi:hypothetical protein
MVIGKGNQRIQRKPLKLPFYLAQISHTLSWDSNLATVVGSWRVSIFQLISKFK